jgi:hypothetical protein
LIISAALAGLAAPKLNSTAPAMAAADPSLIFLIVISFNPSADKILKSVQLIDDMCLLIFDLLPHFGAGESAIKSRNREHGYL